jgi:aspartyl-tRNA synthetase
MENTAGKSRAEMTEDEKLALKAEKKAKKEAEKRDKLARKEASARAAELAAAGDLASAIEFLSIDVQPDHKYGIYKVVQGACGADGSGRTFVALAALETAIGQTVWVRARVHKSVVTSRVAFLRLRKGLQTVQAVVEEDKAMLKWLQKTITNESIVDVQATIVAPSAGQVESCTVKHVELSVQRIYVVSLADRLLPMTLEDAARPLTDDDPSVVDHAPVLPELTDGAKRPTVTRDTRLDARVVDLRVPPHASLLRIQSGICQLFREYLTAHDFVEIHSPKLIAGASEGGSEVFKTDYFGRPACLAQSPQLYKQMAVCGDLSRVFEIGPVFRAEKSDTHRHLCEFTGLDFEMEIIEHYTEILDVLDDLFVSIFDGLELRYAAEVAQVRAKWPLPKFQYRSGGEKNLRLDWPVAVAMLREAGAEMDELEDLSTEKEKLLGKLVKEKYGTDFFMLLRFPSKVRPFYTMTDPHNPEYSNSFDVFMRGEEIVSGAQRVHDVDMLVRRATAILGEEGVDSIQGYIDAFRYGAWPHGGVGVGLERVVMLFLGVGNIRECSLFPRDPRRLTP